MGIISAVYNFLWGDLFTIPIGGGIGISLLVALVMLFIGGLAAYTFVWDLGDIGIGLMTIFNLIAVIPMSGQAIAALKDYEARKGELE